MQINSMQPTTFNSRPVLKRMKYNLGLVSAVLSGLGYVAKDIFVPRKKVYVEVHGKKIDERDLPNSVTGPSDLKGIKWGNIIYAREDVEKMKKMTYDERVSYRSKLIEEGKYTLSEPQ